MLNDQLAAMSVRCAHLDALAFAARDRTLEHRRALHAESRHQLLAGPSGLADSATQAPAIMTSKSVEVLTIAVFAVAGWRWGNGRTGLTCKKARRSRQILLVLSSQLEALIWPTPAAQATASHVVAMQRTY
jgi:hypothetical protein